MKKIVCIFIVLFCVNLWAQSPTPPVPGCRVLTVTDPDNDGFTSFDIDNYLIQFKSEALTLNYDLSGYSLELYPTESDYTAGTNLISSPYTNIVAFEQFCYMKFIYSGSGPFYDSAELTLVFGCHKLETTPALSIINTTQKTVSFYPNPASDSVRFDPEISEAQLFTYDGKSLQVKLQNQILDVSALSKGVYLISGTTQTGKYFTEKLIKE